MDETIRVTNRSTLEASQFEALAREVSEHVSIERALAWFFTRRPALVPEDLIAQDEFSHDLLVPYRDGRYLSYDTS